jgi:Icc-related predicted phosphoesterase
MYGPLNFSFIYDSVKFIVHNTNSREYEAGKIPDMQWLRSEFTRDQRANHFVTVSHIPPFDMDFDRGLEREYASLLKRHNTLISLHGHIHQHKDGYPYNDGIRYMTSHSFDLRSFVLLKIVSGKIYHTIIEY